MTNSNENNNSPPSNDPSLRKLVEPLGVVPIFLYDLFSDIETPLKVSKSPSVTDEIPYGQSARSPFRLLPWIASIAAMIIATITGIQSFGVSHKLLMTEAECQKTSEKLVDQTSLAQTKERRLEFLQPTIMERREGLFPRFISSNSRPNHGGSVQAAYIHKSCLVAAIVWF